MTESGYSPYRSMWLFVLFDLPVVEPEERRAYARFRKYLLEQGFSMLQFSVYARFCENEDASETYRRRIRAHMPPEGQVRMVSITDHQFAKMEVFLGKRPQQPEEPPPLLLLM